MTKLNLIAIAVLSAMPSGYRRAGFSLNKGENSPLAVNQAQYDALDADKNLTVSILDDELAQADIGTHVKSESILATNVEQLRNENALLQGQVDTLTKLCEGQEESITTLEKQLAEHVVITHEDTLHALADSVETKSIVNELDVSSAPEELHHFIAVIDDLNKETPLTKKPNCDLLRIDIKGDLVTPSAAERDAAWAWYEDNVLIAADDQDKG